MVEVRNGCYPSDAADWTGSQPGWQEAPDVTRIYIVAALLPDVAGPIRVPRFAARTTRPAARR